MIGSTSSGGASGPAAEEDLLEEEPKEVDFRPRSVNGAISVTGVTYTDYDSPFDIEEEFSGVRNMHHLSQNSWVGCGDDVFVLDLMGHGHFTVRPAADGLWDVTLARKFKGKNGDDTVGGTKDRFATPMQIVRTKSLAEAISAADVFASTRLHRVTSMMPALHRGLYRFAAWRKKPASQQQKVILARRLGISRRAPDGGAGPVPTVDIGGKAWPVTLDGMTKGQAANLLTRFQHGAKKRLEDRIKKERDDEKRQQRERDARQAGRVTVGRLDGAV